MRPGRAFFDLPIRFAQGGARLHCLLARLAKARDVCTIGECFALRAIAVQAPASVFEAYPLGADRPR